MLLLPQHTSCLSLILLILLLLTRGARIVIFQAAATTPLHQVLPILPAHNPEQSHRGDPLAWVSVSLLAVEFRGSFSCSETLNCHIVLFLDRKILNLD